MGRERGGGGARVRFVYSLLLVYISTPWPFRTTDRCMLPVIMLICYPWFLYAAYHQVNMMSVIRSICRLSSCLYAAHHHFNMTPAIMSISGPSSGRYPARHHVHMRSAIISLCRPSLVRYYAHHHVCNIMPPAIKPICFPLSGQCAAPY